jgi:hypothetical protein
VNCIYQIFCPVHSLYLLVPFVSFRRLGVVTPKVAQSLIMEMGELRRKDIQECLVAVKQIKIIFEQSSGLVSLTEKVLPALFGEAFQVSIHKVQDTGILSVFDFG